MYINKYYATILLVFCGVNIARGWSWYGKCFIKRILMKLYSKLDLFYLIKNIIRTKIRLCCPMVLTLPSFVSKGIK